MAIKDFRKDFNDGQIATNVISIEELAAAYFPEVDYKDKLNKGEIKFHDNEFLKEYFDEKEPKKIMDFKSFKRQLEWISGRFSVKSLILKVNPEIDIRSVRISTKPGGSPYLKDYPDWHISITHSHGFAAGAISFDKNVRIGIDLEKIGKEKSPEFKKLAFSEREIEYLKSKETIQLYISWCVKEAYLKLIEKGFAVALKNIEVLDNEIYVDKKMINDIHVHTETILHDYIFALVYKKS